MEPMLNIALRAARRAGRILLRSMDRVDTLEVREKGRNNLVSEIDHKAEQAIVETILESYPDHAVLGEEGGAHESSQDAEYTWVIDPLDGTTNFLQKIPHFCTSIAVARGATLLHGVIVDPVRNEEFTASRGAGALLNGRRIRVSSRAHVTDSVLASGLPFAAIGEHLDTYSEALKHFAQRCRTLRRQGAAALDLAYVAAGRLDGFFEFGLERWDMAAGAVIVREAGGFVSDTAGGDRFLDTGSIIAANPKVFREMLRAIRASAAPRGDDGDGNGEH